ncbi:uncharacterized protein TNCV_1684641 [Trichonephila clavipes]|nr:uncharacterized protein TNCV_1684641 [Trichonephila clavipes]
MIAKTLQNFIATFAVGFVQSVPKGLTIPGALEVFHNLPSDIDSDESSLSESEDVLTAKSSSSKYSDIDEGKYGISVSGPSRISKVTWKNKVSVKIQNIPFTEQRLMTVRKFIWILGNIHLNDNNLMPKKSEKNLDKLYKVRPLLDHLSEMFFKVFKPGQKQAIDERHQQFSEKWFASNSYSGPMKLKFRKHTVSEKDRLKNVGHIPTKCKSRRSAYCSTSQNVMDGLQL